MRGKDERQSIGRVDACSGRHLLEHQWDAHQAGNAIAAGHYHGIHDSDIDSADEASDNGVFHGIGKNLSQGNSHLPN
jgi:aryl-phospho-beta-D-glucosidase BglC (GH1 family)